LTRRRLFLGLLLVLAAGTWLLWIPALRAAGRFLVISDETPAGDAAVVLSGDASRERLRAALALSRRGAVRGLIVVVGTPPDFYDERAALLAFSRRQGVAPDLVVVTGAAHSTMDDARLAAQVMQARGWRRGVIVTSDYHTRRAGMAFCHVWAPVGLQGSTYAVKEQGSQPERWLEHDGTREVVVLEYVKLVAYALRYGPFC
jgi:uncharacterized SAM-binding protein YcdF (DUF218 family)